MKAFGLGGAAVALAGVLAVAIAAAPVAASDEAKRTHGAAEARLEKVLEAAMEEEPWLTAEERALIERKCGYPAGSKDAKNLTISDGVLHCSNGRKVDDPEVRAMMKVAGPRIEKRVEAIMARPEIKRAIAMVADEASAEALKALSRKWGK